MIVRTRALWTIVALIGMVASTLPFGRVLAQNDEAPQRRVALPTTIPSVVPAIVPTVAAGFKAPGVAPPSASIVGVAQQPFVGIALQDAIGMALLKNSNLAVSSANAKIAGYQVVEAKGAFDVNLQVEPVSSFSVQPPLSFLAAGPGGEGKYVNTIPPPAFFFTPGPGNVIQHQYSFTYGLGGQTVNGTQYTAGIQQTRTYNNTIANSFNPTYLAALNLSVTQPLLRSAGMNAAKHQLKLAIANADESSAQALMDTSNTIAQVEDAYWNLVSAWRNVAIQESALKDAISQQESTARLAKRGAAAPIQAVESSTQVATFQDNVFSALQTVSQLQNQLKGLVVTDPGDPIWTANLVPTSPVQQLPAEPSLDAIVTEALKNRPEVRRALDKYQEANIDLAFAKNRSLPQADAKVTYMSNGFAGLLTPVPPFFSGICSTSVQGGTPIFPNGCPTPPPNTQGAMAQAYHNLWTFAFPAFNIGVTVGFPLGNHVARGLLGVAREEQRQAAVLTAGVAARIGYDARNALQAYQSALSRLHAAGSARAASEQVYASELRKFHNGESTTFLVLQRQVELNRDRGRELAAQTDLNKAVVEIDRVEGTILTKNGVNLQTLGSQALPSSPVPLPGASRLPTPSPAEPQVSGLPAVPTVAPGYKGSAVAPSTADIAGVVQQPFVGIALQDAVGMALLKNSTLAVSSANARIAGYQIVEAKGAFDVNLQVEPVSSFSVQPPLNIFLAGRGDVGKYQNEFPPPRFLFTPGPGNILQHQYSFTYGLGGQTKSGTQYTAGIQQTRTINNTTINTFTQTYLASLNLSVTQPLLRNAGMNAAKHQLTLAVVNADANSAQALVDASNTIAQVENAYWNLVSAWRNVAIQESALKAAISQQESTARLAKRGAAAPIDAIESSTQVASFQDNVFSALETVSQLQNQLKGLVVTDSGDPIWRANLVPTSPVLQLPAEPSLDAIVAEALKYRPEVRQALDKYREANIDLAYAKNQSLPQADVNVTYMSNGFAGLLAPVPFFESKNCPNLTCPTPPPNTQGTMAQAYHNLWTFAFPAFNIGVTVGFPVGDDYGRGLKSVAREEQQQAVVSAAGVAARIGYDARNALQTYQSALSRLQAASTARDASEQVYASELRKFHNGASTTFLVLQRQVELNQNRGRELLAQTDLNKAVVELERVEGTILTNNNVNLQTLGSRALPSPVPTASRLPTPAPSPS
jgi:outer membrane protein TolC